MAFLLPQLGSGTALPGSLVSWLGTPVPTKINFLFNSNFDLSVIETWDANGFTAWNNMSYNFPTDWSANTVICNVTKNAAFAPDHSLTGVSITETAVNSTHGLRSYPPPTSPATAALPLRFAGIFKANTRSRVVLQMQAYNIGGGITHNASVGFDLTGGNVGYDVVADTNWTITASAMTALGSGWWLCYFDAINTDAFSNFIPYVLIDGGTGTNVRNTSYLGDGSSGIYALWASVCPKLGWGIKSTIFFDDFTSNSVDVNNTLSASYKWFVKCNWPAINATFPSWFGGSTNPATVGSTITINDSVLTWADTTQSSTNYIFTAYATVADPTKYAGFVVPFGNPTYVEYRMGWAHPPRASSPTWPAVWTQGVEGLCGDTFPMIELDFMEAFDFQGASTGFEQVAQHVLAWKSNQTSVGAVSSSPGIGSPPYYGRGTYSTLYIPHGAAGGNGIGFMANALDGTWCGGTATWDATNNPEVASADSQHGPIILSGGNVSTATAGESTTWPTYYDHVKVMQ